MMLIMKLIYSIFHRTKLLKTSINLQRYVQDVIRQNSEQVCELILLNGGHIYVCGDVSMASDVSKTLLNLFQEFAALSQIEAQELIAMLRVSRDFLSFVYGCEIPH